MVPEIDQPNDESLLRRIGCGDGSAATKVFEKHAPGLLNAARRRLGALLTSRVDPEDIVQSTFKSFFRRAKNGGYAAPKSGDLFNLLIVIAMRKINAKAAFHRAAGRDVRQTVCSSSYPMDQLHQPDDSTLRELCMTVAEILEEFTPTQREIIRLRLEGFQVAEIAGQVNRGRRTVERELQAFRARLATEFAP